MTLLKSATVVLAAGVLAGCSAGSAPDASEPPPAATVRLTTATMSEIPTTFEAGGVVRAKATAEIASRVLAPVVDVAVAPGDRVRKGQLLVRLDGRELAAAAARASAALAAAEQAVKAAEASALAADASLQLARATHERIAGLHEKRSATPQELDQAVAALRSAQAQADAAQAQTDQATAALDAARAGAEAARVAASYAVLMAPFDGLVTMRAIDPGTTAAPGMPLLTLEDTGMLRLEVRVDASRMASVTAGSEADVRLDRVDNGEAGGWMRGRVTEVSRIDPAAQSFLVKIDLPASGGARSGAFGRARFDGPSRNAITAPATSVVRRGQLAFVFAVDETGAARLRPVSVGTETGGRVEVLAGVLDGERLVENPPPSLVDGTRVVPAAQGGGS